MLKVKRYSHLIKLYFFINFVSVLLKIFSLKKTIIILDKIANFRKPKEKPENPVLFLKKFVPVIIHLSKYTFLRCMCLETSLIIRYFAIRNSIDFILKLGTTIDNGQFKAHAWIEVDKEVVSELVDQRDKYLAFKGAI